MSEKISLDSSDIKSIFSEKHIIHYVCNIY